MFVVSLILFFGLTVVFAQNVPSADFRLDGRIVGGTPITIAKRPYQLSLQYHGRHICGASLIKPDAALTAAHCTNGIQPVYFSVRGGSSYRQSGGQVISVKRICQHRYYNTQNVDYDVSVVLLTSPFTLGRTIQIITLQPVGNEVPIGALATVTGWGAMLEGGAVSNILQEVNIPRVNDVSCVSAYGSGSITPRMTCFGYNLGGKDSCQGDSGGPLYYNGTQAGIVSWGIGCARPYYPGVYTKVSEYSIANHISTCLI